MATLIYILVLVGMVNRGIEISDVHGLMLALFYVGDSIRSE